MDLVNERAFLEPLRGNYQENRYTYKDYKRYQKEHPVSFEKVQYHAPLFLYYKVFRIFRYQPVRFFIWVRVIFGNPQIIRLFVTLKKLEKVKMRYAVFAQKGNNLFMLFREGVIYKVMQFRQQYDFETYVILEADIPYLDKCFFCIAPTGLVVFIEVRVEVPEAF